MNLLPYQNSILVLPFEAQEIAHKLQQRLIPVPNDLYQPVQYSNVFVFNGWIKNNTFRISRRVTHAENFLPLIVGRVEPTSKGSILFIRYRIFPATLFFMGFFCTMVLAASLFFLFIHKDWLTCVFLFLVVVGIYFISILDFNQKVKVSKQLLEKILSE